MITCSRRGPRLPGFEARLLAELRLHVAARGARAASARGRGRHWWSPRPTRIGLAAALACATAGVAVAYATRAAPAYAVRVDDDGRIHVAVHTLTDPTGLKQDLAEHGVTADITYLAPGMACELPRITRFHHVKGGHALTMRSRAHGYDLTLSPDLADSSVTVVIETSVRAAAGAARGALALTVSVAAAGHVTPCRPVPVSAVLGRPLRNAT